MHTNFHQTTASAHENLACSAISTVDRVSHLEDEIRTLNDKTTKLLEAMTQLQIEKDKALVELTSLSQHKDREGDSPGRHHFTASAT